MQPHIDGNKNVKNRYFFERSSDSAHASNFLIHFFADTAQCRPEIA